MKVKILKTFHRFVVKAEGERAVKEEFLIGATVDASEEDAADWIAKGLAEEA